MAQEYSQGAYQALYQTLASMDAQQRLNYLLDKHNVPNPKRLELFSEYLSNNVVELTNTDDLEKRLSNARTLMEISGVVSIAYGVRLVKGDISFPLPYVARKERLMDDLRTRLSAKIDKVMADLETVEAKKAHESSLQPALKSGQRHQAQGSPQQYRTS